MTMNVPDDLPWPELGNVSRGATRGNQGQKGVMGPPDRDGRCLLQLRVQPGVLAVRLNRQASDWYRTLDGEVTRALKLTKTYWRKARRRQDYDARADQDHMELHEWLQQLKDKTMSHLELLMQKGDIQGPPYVMPEDVELSFLRGFIERHAAGLPHNPRLRNGEKAAPLRNLSVESMSPEPSESTFSPQKYRITGECASEASSSHVNHSTRESKSPSLLSMESLTQEASTSKQVLQAARSSLSRAQKDTQDAFLRYTACLDVERQARLAVATAEKRRDDIMSTLLSRTQQHQQAPTEAPRSRHSSASADEGGSPPRYTMEEPRPSSADSMSASRPGSKSMSWPEADGQGVFRGPETGFSDDASAKPPSRKHSRTWERGNQVLPDGQYSACEDITALPPRKRVHHMMPGFDVLGNVPLQSNIPMQS
ncbi:hypothetical protein HGRIS_012410 [Hohenbuehelia grisea]|uniref:Uncharacterized protein n=1 Tax=Hohenbuehelia grisea TaxID=104357 RepID=A0ABR3IS60_9AGAR